MNEKHADSDGMDGLRKEEWKYYDKQGKLSRTKTY
jgi:hypothetical protein